MSFSDAIATAQAGVAIRRDAWPLTKTLMISAGWGTTPAVALIVNGTTIAVMKSTDVVQADYEAFDWRAAA